MPDAHDSRNREPTDAFREEMIATLASSRDRLLHCLNQLDDAQAWHRPRDEMNSVANIVLHVCGNLRQWIVCGVGGVTDDRDRPAEFAARGGFTRDELAARLRATVDEAQATIRGVEDADLARERFVQIGEVTAIGAIIHSVAHLEGHAQETIYATRLLLGPAYRLKDVY